MIGSSLTTLQFFRRVIWPLLMRALGLGCLILSVDFFYYAFFDISDWNLENSNYFSIALDNIASYLQSPTQSVTVAVYFLAFIIGIIAFLIPLIRLSLGRVPHWYKTLNTHYSAPLKKYFQYFLEGGDMIRSASMWMLLYSLIIYMVYDREDQAIDSAWQTIDRAQNSWGDLGRREALNTLIDYDMNIVGVTLNRAELQHINLDDNHDDSWKQPDRATLDLVALEQSDLSFSSFPCVYMRHANLRAAKLYGVRFSGADLRDTDFQGSDFGGSITDETLRPFTDFSFADLRRANLSDPSPQQTTQPDPYGRYLNNMSSTGAWFIGADLRGANIGRKALGIGDEINQEALSFALDNLKAHAQWDQHTTFPPEVSSVLTQWSPHSESTLEKKARWQRLIESYRASFGEKRAARLQSYLHLLNQEQTNRSGNDSVSITDHVCRKARNS